jgi:hypothetical protein
MNSTNRIRTFILTVALLVTAASVFTRLSGADPNLERPFVSAPQDPASSVPKNAQAPETSDAAKPPAPAQGAHMDHKSKHGGTFFMCLDNLHHLEGVLLPPATFRIYLYDDRTKPLKAEKIREAAGTVQIGDAEDAPKIALGPSNKKKEALEASLGDTVKFPVALTVLLHLPDTPADAKPELFNFTFTKFTDENGPGTCVPMAKMSNMCP